MVAPSPDPHDVHVQNFDGSPHCQLCDDSAYGHAQEWCPLLSTLLCRGCCERVSTLTPAAIVEALEHAVVPVKPEAIVSECVGCPRHASTAPTRLFRQPGR